MSLQSIIQQIKTASQPGENTALRVGSAFEQMNSAKRDKTDSLSKTETIDMVNSVKLLAATGTPFLGTIEPSSTIPAGNFWAFASEGTYANAGGTVVGAGEIAIITRVGTTFDSVILDVPVKSIEDVQKTSTVGLVDTYTITYTDGSTPTTFEITNGDPNVQIPDWIAGDYPEKSLTIKDNAIWRVPDGQSAGVGDVPGVSDKWVAVGGKIANEFDKDNDTEAVSAADIADYIGEFPENAQSGIVKTDHSADSWINNAYVTGQGVITPNNTMRYIAIPTEAGTVFAFKGAVPDGVNTFVFVGESGAIQNGYVGPAGNPVYSFSEVITEKGILYFNQRTTGSITVNYLFIYSHGEVSQSLVDYIDGKFKVNTLGAIENIDVVVGSIGNFYNLNLAEVGVSNYGTPKDIAANYDSSIFYKVSAGEKFLVTMFIGWNGLALFDENKILSHKLLYSPAQATQVTDVEIVIPFDGYMQMGYDRTKPHALKKTSEQKEITIQEIYDGVVNSTASMTNQTYINLNKPNNAWRLNLTGDLPTASDQKNTLECVFNDAGKNFLKCKVEVALQGQSSLGNPKKNFTFDFLNAADEALQLKIGGLIASDSWHFKGFQKDVSMLRDNLLGSLWFQIRKSAPFPSCTLTTLPNNVSPSASDLNYFEEDARFFADGFPVEIYVNDIFHGLYIFRLKKSRQNYKLDNKLKSNIMLEFDYMLDIANGVRLLDWNVFDYKQYELKSPKITGYVAGGAISDTTVMNSINGLWSWSSAIFNNTATNENAIDLTAWIDYLIACEVGDHWDGFNQNIIIISHDGVRFMPYIYDMDHTWGIRNDGTEVKSTKTSFMLDNNLRPEENKAFWKNFRTKYNVQIKARYSELRKSGIISVQNIEKTATDFIKPYGNEHFKKEFTKWGYGVTPIVGKASLRQILQMANASISYLDGQWLNP